MNREGLLEFAFKMCNTAHCLMKNKNRDYAGADGENPFANFKTAARVAATSIESYMLGRIAEKVDRAATICLTGRHHVTDETLYDTLVDLINYSILVAAYIESQWEPKATPAPTTQETE